MIKFVNILVLI
ncbi:hypothetical protein SPV_2566 [Streptococcus pneumoniae]|nr:hypothetical protein SPV_2566 [Streptococcus pneumoniae]